MAKTKEELAQIKNEYEAFTTKLQELTEDELNNITGGQQNFLAHMGTIGCVIGGAQPNIVKGTLLSGVDIPLDFDSKLKKD